MRPDEPRQRVRSLVAGGAGSFFLLHLAVLAGQRSGKNRRAESENAAKNGAVAVLARGRDDEDRLGRTEQVVTADAREGE